MKNSIFVRILGLALLFLLLGGVRTTGIAAAPTAQSTATATIGTGALNVRSGPAMGYSVVTVCYQGQVVTMLGRNSNNSWVKVRVAAGHEGWVSAPYIIPNVAIASLPVVDTTSPSTTATGTVATGALNIRTGPGVGYSVVTAINQGTSVTLLGRNGNSSWVKVRLSNGTEGWANASLITANVALSSLPVLDGSTPSTTASAIVATGALNVRYGPGVSYGAITAVYEGAYLTLLGRNSGSSWVKVRLNSGTEGWVNASLIVPSVAISSLPVLSGGGQWHNPTPYIRGAYGHNHDSGKCAVWPRHGLLCGGGGLPRAGIGGAGAQPHFRMGAGTPRRWDDRLGVCVAGDIKPADQQSAHYRLETVMK